MCGVSIDALHRNGDFPVPGGRGTSSRARSLHVPRHVPSPMRSPVRFVAIGASLLVLEAGCLRSAMRPVAPALPDSAAQRQLAAECAKAARSGAIGVPPFVTQGANDTTSALAHALADLVATDLARSGQLMVVERSRLGEVLRELDLGASGTVDTSSAPRAGRLLGAERLLLGSVDPLPSG